MGPSRKLVWQIYSGVLGALATMAAQKTVNLAFKAATGDKPRNPNDPRTPFSEAASWALASAIGVGVAQLVVSRYTARRWQANMGDRQTKKDPKGKVKIAI